MGNFQRSAWLTYLLMAVGGVSAQVQQAPAGSAAAYTGRQAAQPVQPMQQAQPMQPQVSSNAAQSRGIPAGAPAPMPTPLPQRDLVQDALDQTAPLTPDEVRQFLTELAKRNRAGAENLSGRPPAKPVTSVETLDLTPGATPPVIRVAMGQGAVVSFVDAAGRPWTIVDDINFNATGYEVKLIGAHLYTIKLNRPSAANITVVLKDLPRPVTFTALPATDEADYLKEFTIPKFIDGKPPASVAAGVTMGALALNAPELLDFLYRTPPKEARALGVLGMPGVMAWQNSAATMVVRTSGLLVLPAWKRRHSSTDGVAVYEVPLSPMVTVVQDGIQHRLSINGFVVPSQAKQPLDQVSTK